MLSLRVHDVATMTNMLVRESILLSDRLYRTFDEERGTMNDRARLAAAMFDVAHEHHRSIGLLVRARLYGSAFVLLRPTFESCLNGIWLSSLAREAEVETFSAGTRPLPKPARILRSMKKSCSTHHQALQTFYDRDHGVLDDYVHGGHMQASSRLCGDIVGSDYPLESVDYLLVSANWLALLAAFELAQLANNDRLAIDVVEIARKYVNEGS